MQQLGFDLMVNPEFIETCKKQYFYQPLANTFTLGIYGMVQDEPVKVCVAEQDQD